MKAQRAGGLVKARALGSGKVAAEHWEERLCCQVEPNVLSTKRSKGSAAMPSRLAEIRWYRAFGVLTVCRGVFCL